MRLSIDTPRRVYYRGEEIAGTIRAVYRHGAPVAGRGIAYQLGDDPPRTAQTDEQGRVAFRLPTPDFAESQVLPLKVSWPDWDLQTAVNLYLSAQEFTIQVTTVRDAFLGGEDFAVTVRTSDVTGQPVARQLTAEGVRTGLRRRAGE